MESIQKNHNEIQNAINYTNLNGKLDTDPNINYNTLHEVIQQAKLKHMSIQLVKFDKHKHVLPEEYYNPFSRGIIYIKYHKMTDLNLPEFDVWKINLMTYINILKKGIRLDKNNYYEALFTQFNNDIRGTWKTINGILNKINRKKNVPIFFKDRVNIMYDKKTITNIFNIVYFC